MKTKQKFQTIGVLRNATRMAFAILAAALVFGSCSKNGDGIDGDLTPDCYLVVNGVPSGITLQTVYLLDSKDLNDYATAEIGGVFESNRAALIYASATTEAGGYWEGGAAKYVFIYGSDAGSNYPVLKVSKSKKSFSKGDNAMDWSEFEDISYDEE
jgi:hypothetical protein